MRDVLKIATVLAITALAMLAIWLVQVHYGVWDS